MELSLMCNQQLNYELVIDDTNEQQKILNHDSQMYSNYQNSIVLPLKSTRSLSFNNANETKRLGNIFESKHRSIRFLQLIF